MTHYPPSRIHEARRKFVRRVGMALSLLMALTLATVLFLVIRDRLAHDESKCPFAPLSERAITGGRIIEQARSCTKEISERRYLLERSGRPAFEISVRRLPPDRFAVGRYRWEVREDSEHKVTVDFHVDGQLTNQFRERDVEPP